MEGLKDITWISFVILLVVTCSGQVSTGVLKNISSLSRRNDLIYFTSQSSHIVANYGDEISIVCSVAKNTENIKLDWWFVNYEVQLSNGSYLLIRSNNYRLQYITKPSGEYISILTMVEVKPTDVGFYKCRYDTSSGSYEQFNKLLIEGNLQIEDELYDYEDMSECCLNFGLSGKCLDLCSPFELFPPEGQPFTPLREEFKVCGGRALLALMRCGAGRNNIPCCLERNVSSKCSKLCNGIFEPSKDIDLDGCSDGLVDIALCFSRGLANIPPPMDSIHITRNHPFSITIGWSTPLWSHGDDEDSLPWLLVFRTNDLSERHELVTIKENVSNLTIQLLSTIEILSFIPANQNGASNRGNGFELEAFKSTRESSVAKFVFSECCLAQKIPFECQTFLCGDVILVDNNNNNNNNNNNTNLSSCYQHVEKVTYCLKATNQDRTECCHHQKVSNRCLPLCNGSVNNKMEMTFDMLKCLKEMPYIKNCLDEGSVHHDLLPPTFLASNITCCSITLEWQPYKEITPTSYVIRYRSIADDRFLDIFAASTNLVLDDLKPNTRYEVFLVSIHGYQGKQIVVISDSIRFQMKLSPDIWKPKITAAPSIPIPGQNAVEIMVDPSTPLIPIGQRVILTCFSRQSKPSLPCHWAINSLIIEQVVLEIWSANETSSGVYTCVCGRDHKSYTLNVQSAPTFIRHEGTYQGISPQTVVRISKSSHLAEITCHFSGFPNLVTWYKDGREINVSSSSPSISSRLSPSSLQKSPPDYNTVVGDKFASTKYSHENQGILYYKLSIEPFEDDDVGRYSCVGSNGYASDSGEVYLAIDDDTPIEIMPVKNHPVTAFDCCKEMNVSDLCMDACTYVVDIEKLMGLSWRCYEEFQKIMHCSARGWNYTTCCSEAEIPRPCQSLCQGGGVKVDLDSAHGCIDYANEMINCHSKGHSFAPPPPSFVNLSTLPNGLLVLRALKPLEKLNMVHGYLINWTSTDGDDDDDDYYRHIVKGHQILRPDEELSYHGYNLEPFRSYSFSVQSYNRHSLSVPYNLTGVLVKEPPIFEKLEISFEVSRDQRIHIRWENPTYKHAETCVVFVYVSGDDDDRIRRRNVSKDDEPILQVEGDLKTGAATTDPVENGGWYRVVARIKSTNYDGPWSDVKHIFIPERSLLAAVIVAFAVCTSVGTLIVIIAWIIGVRFRRKKTLSQESVSFDNSTHLEVEPELQVHLPGAFHYHEFRNENEEDSEKNRSNLSER